MTADGFRLAACDGSMPQGGLWNALPPTPEFAGIRPDACGFAERTSEFAFGEAKTFKDIDTAHTRRQLQVFANLILRNRTPACRLYIAVPRSAAQALDRALCQVGLQGARQVVRLHIPDCFISDDSDERD